MFSNNFVGWTSGLHLHAFFGLVLLVGVILFIAWALKALDKKSLMKLAVGLVVVGAIGALLTVRFSLFGIATMMGGGNENGFIQQEMQKEMQKMMGR